LEEMDHKDPEVTAELDNESEGSLEETEVQLAEASVEQIKQEAEEWKNRFIRLQADFDNYRKRVSRERLEERDRGIEEVVTALFAIADNLTRAVKAAHESSDYSSLLKGVEMINDQLTQLLAQFEVTPIEAMNTLFDPNLHHAVMHLETTEFPADTVIAELQTGYQRKGRVLRPSMVQVAINSGSSQGGNEDK